MQAEYISYDENVDHLTIFKTHEPFHSTLDTGLVLLSFNEKKEIVGLEFMGAQKNFKIPRDALMNLR